MVQLLAIVKRWYPIAMRAASICLVLLAACGPSPVAQAADFSAYGKAPVLLRVIDGDTLAFEGATVRIENIDAPEMPPRSRCRAEADLAMRATAELRAFVRTGVVGFAPSGMDRYGRTLALVHVGKKDVGEHMVARRLARPWRGRREPWCAN